MNKTFPYSVEPDFGLNYIDQNRHRIPSAPLLPLFKAVDVVTQARKELIDWPSVDFITDRNNLRKLLRWVHADGSNAKGREFRIDLQLAGKQTVLMNRWDKRITTWSDGAVHPGYGYNFEKASTRSAPGCEKTIGHNRIIKYVSTHLWTVRRSPHSIPQNLGKFTLVVRFDVDAYLPDMGAAAPIPESQPAGNVDALAGQLAGMSVSSNSIPSEGTDIQIVRAGAYIQQNSIMELMTRTEKNGNFQWSNTYPQLFLSQTPHFFVAIQSNGNFTRLKRRNLDNPEVKNVGLGMQPDFRKLLAALEKIQEVVVASGNEGRYSLVHEGGDMKVYKRANQSSCLPEDVLSRFDS